MSNSETRKSKSKLRTSSVKPKPQTNRVCILVDIDAFDVQVCQKYLYPETVGKPCIVSHSLNPLNSLAAANYEAKSFGILRQDNVTEAILKCRTVCLIRFPNKPGSSTDKRDMSLQMQATKEILSAALEFCNEYNPDVRPILEYSSCDEFYLDVTTLVDSLMLDGSKSNSMLGIGCLTEEIDSVKYKYIVEEGDGSILANEWTPVNDQDCRLLFGLKIAAKVVQIIKTKTRFQASAGVGPNKLITKLACGLNKPAALTLILPSGLEQVSRRIAIPSIPGLGGSAGKTIMSTLQVDKNGSPENVRYMADLLTFTQGDIAHLCIHPKVDEKKIGAKKAALIHRTVRGITDDFVRYKLGPKAI